MDGVYSELRVGRPEAQQSVKRPDESTYSTGDDNELTFVSLLELLF